MRRAAPSYSGHRAAPERVTTMGHIALERGLTSREKAGWDPSLLRLLLAAQYGLFGLIIGAQGALWGEVKGALGLGEGVFGTLMAVTPLVGFFVLIAGAQMQRFSLRRLGLMGLLAIAGALVALAAARGGGLLLLARVLAGLGFALLDGAVNLAAVSWEERTKRAMLGTLYGLLSAGMIAGSLAGGALLEAGLAYRQVLLLLVPCVLLVAAATMLVRYPPHEGGRASTSRAQAARASWRGPVLVLVVLSLLGTAGEALAELWSVVYLQQLGASAMVASGAFAVFSAAMILGRLIHTGVIARGGARLALALAGGGVAAAAALLGPGTGVAAVAAFGLLGLDLAGVLPTLLTAARSAPDPAQAVRSIVAATYLSFVIAPPLAGWAAELWGLRLTLLALLGGIALGLLILSQEL